MSIDWECVNMRLSMEETTSASDFPVKCESATIREYSYTWRSISLIQSIDLTSRTARQGLQDSPRARS